MQREEESRVRGQDKDKEAGGGGNSKTPRFDIFQRVAIEFRSQKGNSRLHTALIIYSLSRIQFKELQGVVK